jgi:hypothetical protein
MSTPPARQTPSHLAARLETLGRALGEREAEHAEALEVARGRAEQLREQVAEALDRFHAAAAAAGAPHLRVDLSAIRVDDKHLRAAQFELARGRHRAIVTTKSRRQITLVGPYRFGKAEEPCRSFPFDAGDELEQALAAFLESFLKEAAAP